MRRSSPRNAACSRHALLFLIALAVAGCGPHWAADGPGDAPPSCEVVDSLLSQRGLPRPSVMKGRAVFDVEQYQVRGRFELRLDANGDAALEFSGATLLGGHREEVLVSLALDTLRVLDRERGRFYEGPGVEALIREEARAPGDWCRAVRRALADPDACPLESVEYRADGLAGAAPDGPFRLRWKDGRLVEAVWPDPAPGETFDDHLVVRYEWTPRGLARLEARLPARGWRVRLEAD